MSFRKLCWGVLAALLFVAADGSAAETKVLSWKQVDQLVSDQKFEAAAQAAEVRLDAAKKANDEVWAMREALGERPITDEAEFVLANTYPKGVRDTMRDLVSYVRAASLEETSAWRPEQQSEVYALDKKALIAGDVAQSGKLKL